MKKIITIAIIAVFVIVGGAYYFLRPQTQFTPLSPTSAVSLGDKVALAQLQTDLQDITPHSINASKSNGQSLTPTEQKIKDDIIALFTVSGTDGADYYSRLRINAMGKRYILASQPSARSSFDEIIDSKTGMVSYFSNGASYIPYYLASEKGRDAVLYIGGNDMFTYTLDQPEFVLVPNSRLPKGETYHSGESDFGLIVHETHTKNSVTISVFDELREVHNPLATPGAMDTINEELRKETLYF